MLKHHLRFLYALLALHLSFALSAQCPQLTTAATLTSPNCVSGTTSCDICPGDIMTLTPSGTNLQPGTCINWYYGTTNTFNPYLGQGTLMGCSMVTATPPDPCTDCPVTLGIFVDACGTEENNEFMALWSGSGFFVNDLKVDFDAANNNGMPENADIGAGCGWQEPSAAAIASIQSFCPDVTVVGAGPGEAVPPSVPVLVLTSASYNAIYDFTNLCSLAPVIYIMQSACSRSIGAFTNGGAGGVRNTVVSLPCGCTDNTSYNTALLVGNDGAFVTDANLPIPFYGNSGCVFPAFPGLPNNPASPISVAPFNDTIAQGMCNGGPYYAVGIVEPQSNGCGQTFTNYLPFNVPCPVPVLGTANVCQGNGIYNLVQIQDPNVPAGSWSGPGVSGSDFDPSGLSGTVTLTFTPFAACGTAVSTTLNVSASPAAFIEPLQIQCPGQNVDLSVSFTGQAPWSFDLYQDGNLLGSYTTMNNPFSTPVAPTMNTTFSISNFQDAVCNGPDASISVIVPQAATAQLTLNSPSSVCSGSTADFSVQVTGGSAPYTIVYAIDGVQQAPVVTNFNPYTFQVPINMTTNVALVSVDAGGCAATVSGSYVITVASPLSAVISGGGQICQGGAGTDIIVTFTGAGPYTFTYTADNVLQPTVVTNNNPYVFNVSPSSGTIYVLTSVSNGTCTGAVSGVAIVFVFTPSTASLAGDATLCVSADTTVMVDFTGTGPFELVYAIDGVAQPADTTFDDPFFIPVMTNVTQTFTLVSVHSPGCTGIVNGQATVTVNYPPAYANLNLNCNPVNNDYTVEFDVTGATLPLTLLTGTGTFTGTHFVSDPIPQSQNYQFVFHDAHDCGDINVAGPSICNCVSASGSMQTTDTLSACNGAVVTAVYNGTPTLDADDSLRFLLHTTAGLPLGQILGWSSTPSFGLMPGMTMNTVYYISALAGNYAGNDSIDLADPCLSVSAGAPIIFYNSPGAILGADQNICAGGTATVPVTLNGTGPFDLSYAIDGVPQSPVTGVPGPVVNIILSPADTAYVTLLSVSDQHCSSLLSDTMAVNVRFVPQITNLNSNCDPVTASYAIDFDIQGGTPPYFVSGLPGTLNGLHFTSDPIPSGQPYTVFLNDSFNCGFASATDTITCACVTDAGTMSALQLKLCPGDTAHAAAAVSPMLGSGDILEYVLHTGAGAVLGTVISTSLTPDFPFVTGTMQTGTVYYISAVAGNQLGAGVDMNDPCLSISAGTPVVWNVAPTANLSGNYDVCPGQTQILNISFTGQSPFNFTYTKNGTPSSSIALSNNFALSTTLLQSTLFQLVSVQDANCPGTVSGQANITVHPVPQIINPVTTCNPDNLHYTVEFDVQNADFPSVSTGGNLTGLFNAGTGHFTSNNGNLPGPYLITVEDNWHCGIDTLQGMPSCSCTTDAGILTQPALNVCFGSNIQFTGSTGASLDANDVLQYVLCSDPAMLPQSILARSLQPQFAFLPALQAGQTYYVVALAGNPLANGDVDMSDPCFSKTTALQVNVRALPTATIAGDTTVCMGSNFAFPVLFTGNAPYQFSYTINNGAAQPTITAPQNSFAVSTNNVQQTQVFNLVFVQDQFCSGTVSGSVTVNIQAAPVVSLSGDTRICPGGTATLTLGLQNATSCNFTLAGSNGAGSTNYSNAGDGFTMTVSPTQSTNYTLQNVQANGNICPLQLSGSAQIDLSPMNLTAAGSDFNGYGVRCFAGADGTGTAQLSGGFTPVSLLWSNGSTGLVSTGLAAGAYSVTATDAQSCTAVASIELTEPEPITADWSVRPLDCRPGSTGSLTMLDVQMGVGPYTVQAGNLAPVLLGALPQTISGLPAGAFALDITDANGCSFSGMDTIAAPNSIGLSLGPDQTIYPGDSTLLTGVVSGDPLQSLTWTPTTGLRTPASLSTWAAPQQSTRYTLTVSDTAGCTASADVMVLVLHSNRVYAPNIIKQGAGQNNIFTVYGGPELKIVHYLAIYDRWGDQIFETEDLEPNNPARGWDGTWNGKEIMPGVYTYIFQAEYQDGTTEIFSGGITVVR